MKILVVDDDSICRTLLLKYLSGHGMVQGAANGREGLIAFQDALDHEDPYDLICLDIMMPGIDGQEVLRLIRQVEDNRGIKLEDQTKVIMITGLSDTPNIIRAFEKGRCDAYLSKPINLPKLGSHLLSFQKGTKLDH